MSQNRLVRSLAAAKRAFFAKEPEKNVESAKQEKSKQNGEKLENERKVTSSELPQDIGDVRPEYCSGCGACFNLCPVHAIQMKYDKEGFLTPVIDQKKCIHCGLCVNKCPAVHPIYENEPRPKCYAAYGDDEIRMKSSSGAIFSLVSAYVLSQGGYICGAAYDDQFHLKHMLVSSEDDMQKLRESKYVQSDTNIVFQEIGNRLKKGKMVLFCGCGCQIAGLNAYLSAKKIDTKWLYTLDLMCHGAPSPKLFEKYINEVHGGHEIESISFRSKEYFGWSTEMNVKYKDGGVYRKTRGIDPYYKAFLPCISVRRSCGHCMFAKLPRQGDLTLADFWGVKALNADYDDGKGTSIVVVNNKKGRELMAQIQPQLKLCSEVDIEYILTHGQPFDHSFRAHSAHDLYFKYINLGASMEKAYHYAVNRKFDVAIMGVWSGCNYGSVATYYALHELVRSYGLSVLMIDKPLVSDKDPEQGMTHSRRFAMEHYEISRRYKLGELKALNPHVDTFLMGCDQVWNRGISRNFGWAYYFDFVDNDKKKISYAASFGHDRDFANINERTTISHYLKQFDAISVRESNGVDICREIYDVEAVQVLDPVFVADKEIFLELVEKAPVKKEENAVSPYLLTYILDPTPEKCEAVKWVSEKLGLKLINVLDGLPWKYGKNKETLTNQMNQIQADVGEIPQNVQVEDWLYYIKNSEFVITDSCHGMSFAIIFEKKFIAIGNVHRGLSRFTSLMNLLELSDRLVLDAREIPAKEFLLQKINYQKVNEILEREKRRSREWLKKTLFAPKKIKSYCVYGVYDERLEER